MTGEVAAHLAEIYGAQVYHQPMSTITDKVIEGMAGLACRFDCNRIVHDPGEVSRS